MVLIRAATSEDAESIHSVHIQSISQICSRDYTPAEIAAWTSGPKPESYVKAMEEGEKMFVAVADGQIAGFTGIKSDEICAVYVHPAFVGKGIGKALLDRAEKHLVEQNISEGRLNASKTAKVFYLHHGWEIVQEVAPQQRCGVNINCIGMKKQLSRAEN